MKFEISKKERYVVNFNHFHKTEAAPTLTMCTIKKLGFRNKRLEKYQALVIHPNNLLNRRIGRKDALTLALQKAKYSKKLKTIFWDKYSKRAKQAKW